MIKFITKIFKIIFILLISFIIFAIIFSIKTNMSFEETISYFKNFGSEILGSNGIENPLENSNMVNAPTTSSNNNYYYLQLNDTSKFIYDTLESNIDNLKKENYVIDFSTSFNDILNESSGQYKLNRAFQSALDAFFYDHPELFYLELTKISLNIKSIAIGPITTYKVEIVPQNNKNYLNSNFNSEKEVNAAITKVEDLKDKIVNTVSNKDLYNKIKDVHDILVDSLKYDETLSKENIHNIYGALVQKEVVCEGYAKAFKYIMDCLDIECILISGDATNTSGQSEAHMWNYVKLDNKWYGVDITWDDPIIIGGNGKTNIRHDYFLKGGLTFVNSHSPSGKISDTGMIFSIPTLSNKNYKW